MTKGQTRGSRRACRRSKQTNTKRAPRQNAGDDAPRPEDTRLPGQKNQNKIQNVPDPANGTVARIACARHLTFRTKTSNFVVQECLCGCTALVANVWAALLCNKETNTFPSTRLRTPEQNDQRPSPRFPKGLAPLQTNKHQTCTATECRRRRPPAGGHAISWTTKIKQNVQIILNPLNT